MPDTWSVLQGEAAGSTAEVVRRFDLIDGGGERVVPEKDDEPEEAAPATTPEVVSWQVYRQAVADVERRCDKHLTDLKEAYQSYRADTLAFLDGAAALKAIVIPGDRHKVNRGGQVSICLTVLNLGPLTWTIQDVEAVAVRVGEPANPDWSATKLRLTLVDKGLAVPPTTDVDAWTRIRLSGSLSKKWKGPVKIDLQADVVIKHGADVVRIPVISEGPFVARHVI